jgi:hypothetical protein
MIATSPRLTPIFYGAFYVVVQVRSAECVVLRASSGCKRRQHTHPLILPVWRDTMQSTLLVVMFAIVGDNYR